MMCQGMVQQVGALQLLVFWIMCLCSETVRVGVMVE
jgi:hypothetical protein